MAFERRAAPQRGLTLVEVMVALMIVSLALAAIGVQTLQTTRTARIIQTKTLANWIALNKMTELRLTEGLPDTGRDQGEIDYAGAEWHWESDIEVAPGDNENLLRIDVSVSLATDPESMLAVVAGFAGRGALPANRRAWDVRLPANGGDDSRPETAPQLAPTPRGARDPG